ncbi:mechanosensitive ion channel family protein [Teredinibacter sp. KSP-S5-2]|uniref:mechanosensitive ion channel family protein n=1 Tax=Teredinibacter sp. KSP-S5-2 TaxID=3034506 RepID=UPI002934556E|nr:mechanosensitive ion channel domain-containing protein [Teredinibacter sp. KSP-S5-2]WNO10248.1 mechanosensitive ion channel [Teredinibacter sp. KSP-S5-2]
MIDQIKSFFVDGNWVDAVLPLAQKAGVALLIFIIGIWIANHVVRFVKKLLQLRKLDDALTGFVEGLLSALLKFVVLLIAVEQLGIDTTSLLALLGAAGLAIGLALKDSLSNFAAGVMLIVFKPFKAGDFVEAGGIMGIVESVTIFNTLFRSGDNKEIIVPNAQIYGGTIINYSARATRRIDLIIGISYDDDMKKARQLMLDVINSDERILKDPEPVIAVDALADSSVNFVVRPWVNSSDYWAVRWHLLEAIKESFDANGITIPYPQQTVYMHSAETK